MDLQGCAKAHSFSPLPIEVMGNCCCNDRREDTFPPTTESKDPLVTPPRPQLPIRPVQPKDSRTGSILSTTGSDTKEMRRSEPMLAFQHLLTGLERQDVLSEAQHMHTKEWMGTVDIVCAQTAIKVALALQSREFEEEPLIRLGYYSLFKQTRAFNTILTGLHSEKRCIRYTFARLLQVTLSVYCNLTFNITHDLLSLDILPKLEQGLKALEPPEYWVCLSDILHCLYFRNLYVQSLLLRPSCYSLVTEMVRLLAKLKSPLLIRTHAENLKDFALRFDGEDLEENWKCLQLCGLPEAAIKARETLSYIKGGDIEEIARADTALRQLLAY